MNGTIHFIGKILVHWLQTVAKPSFTYEVIISSEIVTLALSIGHHDQEAVAGVTSSL